MHAAKDARHHAENDEWILDGNLPVLADPEVRSALLAKLDYRLSEIKPGTMGLVVATSALIVNLDEVVDRMVAAIPQTSELDARVGPFYTTASLRLWLGITRQALHQQAKRRRVLALTLTDGVLAYPVWQFTTTGEPLPSLAEVSRILDPDGSDPLTVALALNTPWPSADNRTGAELLRSGETETVMRMVSRAARALAS
ncbi:MAG: hypothetical protein ABI400_07515 [Lacisediminihabitans sp.]